MASEPDDLRERVESLPGLDRVLPALAGLPRTYLVGGAVRDLLRGAASVDLDLAVEGDAPVAARALAERLGGEAVEHGRFGTAKVRAGGLELDLATARRERYERPGALPAVETAPLADDLARRDFSVNAMAIGLCDDDLGQLHDPHGGLRDLHARIIRVLHERSFEDDATRILRALRYEARLGFRMDRRTEELARAAAGAGMLDTVAGSRVRDELLDLLREHEAPSAVERMGEVGVDRALHPSLRAERERVASAALGSLETGADRALAALAAMLTSVDAAVAAWLDRTGFEREQREAVLRAAARAPQIARTLRAEMRPSDLHGLLTPEPPETLALALALGAPGEPVLRFLRELRGVRLEIGGQDLLAAGVPEGPQLGRGLAEALRRKLDGEVSGREAELAAALEAAR